MTLYQVGCMGYDGNYQLLFCIQRSRDFCSNLKTDVWGWSDGGWTHLIYKGIV